jgi:hypothetical protein
MFKVQGFNVASSRGSFIENVKLLRSVQIVSEVPDVPIVPNVSAPTSFLPRGAGEDEGGGLNG